MPGAMRYSRSSALLGKMILTRRTSMHPKPKLWSRPDPSIAANQPAMQQLRHGLAMAQSSVCLQEDRSSHPINRQILRERLLRQRAAINSTDDAALWARQNPSAKNMLTAGDARIVGEEFQRRLSTIGEGEDPGEPSISASVRNVVPTGRPDAGGGRKTSETSRKLPRNGAVRTLGKTVRLRDKDRRKRRHH